MALVASFSVVTDFSDPLFAAFPPVPGMPIKFQDTSSWDPGDPIVSWSWTFQAGEEAASSYQNPIRSFKSTGTKVVSLTVTTVSLASDTVSKNLEIYPFTGVSQTPLDLNNGTYLDSSQVLTVGPVVNGTKLLAVTSETDGSANQHLVVVSTSPFAVEARYPLPNSLVHQEVTRHRMRVYGSSLFFVGNTDLLFYSVASGAPVAVQHPEYTLKGITSVRGSGLWVLAKKNDSGDPHLLRIDTATNVGQIAQKVNLKSILPSIAVDDDAEYIAAGPNIPANAYEPSVLIYPKSLYWDGSPITAPEFTRAFVYRTGAGEVYTLDTRPFSPFAIARDTMTSFLAASSFDPYVLQARSGLSSENFAFFDLFSGNFLVYDWWWDGGQSVWILGRDELVNPAYLTARYRDPLSQPSGQVFVAEYNMELHEFTRVLWDYQTIQDHASGVGP